MDLATYVPELVGHSVPTYADQSMYLESRLYESGEVVQVGHIDKVTRRNNHWIIVITGPVTDTTMFFVNSFDRPIIDSPYRIDLRPLLYRIMANHIRSRVACLRPSLSDHLIRYLMRAI